jgi:transglycosylase-like protein with SLT domain
MLRLRTALEMALLRGRHGRGRSRSLGAAAFVIALLVLLVSPADLVGETYQTNAIRQHRYLKIESWLCSQIANEDMADVLARSILHESEKHSLDPVLILALIHVESRFDHRVVSPRGAQGLMQVLPIVVTELVDEGKISVRVTDLKDPCVNVQVGISYLAHLNEMFGDLRLALTAYNWGPTRIKRKLVAKETIPLQYANKVLRMQRAMEDQLGLNGPGQIHGGKIGVNAHAVI